MRITLLLPGLTVAALIGCAHAPADKKVYVLDGDETAKTVNGPVVVHVIPFWGKAADHNTVVVANPESKPLLEAVLQAAPPATATTVETFGEFVSQYIQKEKDPQVVMVQDELKDHAAVVISNKRERGGFWSRLFGG